MALNSLFVLMCHQ